MLKNLKKLIRDFIPNPTILKKNHSAAFFNTFDAQSAAISRLEAFPHFDFESHEDLTKYTNISLVHPKDSNIFLNGIDTFIFDCDGVIYEGDKLLENSINTINLMKSLGKKVLFLTNSSNITRKKFQEKLLKRGVQTSIDDVFCASYLSALFFRMCLPNINSVYLIGTDEFKYELKNVGLNVYGGEEDNDKIMNSDIFRKTVTDPDVEAVIIGEDERFNYYKLNMASLYLLNNPNCILFAANIDNYDNINKRNYSSTGPLLAAIEAVSNKKCKYTAGKPNPFMYRVISNKYKSIKNEKTCIIGDRLNTDIAFAKNCNIVSLLVLSGVTKFDYFNEEAYAKGVRPNYVLSHAGKIYENWMQTKGK